MSGDNPAVAEDRDLVGNPQDFVDAMGDIDDGHAALAGLMDLTKEKAGFAIGQRCRRFVEDQDAAIPRKTGSDLDHLPGTDAEGTDGGRG